MKQSKSNLEARRLVRKIRRDLKELGGKNTMGELEVNYSPMALDAIREICEEQLEILDRNLFLFPAIDEVTEI
jgi:hypothetical protein